MQKVNDTIAFFSKIYHNKLPGRQIPRTSNETRSQSLKIWRKFHTLTEKPHFKELKNINRVTHEDLMLALSGLASG